MKTKKIWLSYPLWLGFTALAGIMLAVYLSAIGNRLWETGKYAVPLFICLAFAAVGGIWFLGYKTARVLHGRFLQDEHSRKMAECFFVMSLAAFALLYRIRLLKSWDVLQDMTYYNMALIKSSGGVPEIAHGASYVYTWILSALLSFTGNREIAGAALQAAIQLMTLLFLYFGVKLLSGRVEALCVMAIMAFLPAYARQIYCLTPESFSFFLFAAGIFGAGLCARTIGEQKKTAYGAFFLMGLYTGLSGYLDGTGLLLLLFSGSLAVKEGMQGKAGYLAGRKKFLLLLFGTAAAMFALMALDAGLSGSRLESIWHTWLAAFAGNGSLAFPAGPGSDLGAGALLCFCAALGTVGFWFHGKQKQDAWIFYLLAVTIMDMVSAGPLEYQVFIAFGWSILAGVGIASMGIYGEEENKVKIADMPELILEDMDDMAETEEIEEKAEIEGLEEERPKVKLIENPLPLPKKHVRREMDFDRIVEWDKMKFDVSVEEGDDFDI